jgi:hypothetical protein
MGSGTAWPSREDDADVDALVPQFYLQSLIQTLDCELAGAIKGIRRNAALARQAADRHQRTLAGAGASVGAGNAA